MPLGDRILCRETGFPFPAWLLVQVGTEGEGQGPPAGCHSSCSTTTGFPSCPSISLPCSNPKARSLMESMLQTCWEPGCQLKLHRGKKDIK